MAPSTYQVYWLLAFPTEVFIIVVVNGGHPSFSSMEKSAITFEYTVMVSLCESVQPFSDSAVINTLNVLSLTVLFVNVLFTGLVVVVKELPSSKSQLVVYDPPPVDVLVNTTSEGLQASF